MSLDYNTEFICNIDLLILKCIIHEGRTTKAMLKPGKLVLQSTDLLLLVSNTCRGLALRKASLASPASRQGSLPGQFVKIKEKQKAWAVDNGLRVHERGRGDKLMMIASQTLLVVGGALWLQEVYKMGFPRGLWK